MHRKQSFSWFSVQKLSISVIIFQSRPQPIQRVIIDFSGLVVWQGGDFAGELWLVFLAEIGETFGLEIFAGFDFDGDNDTIFLNHKINFACAPFVGPIADEITFCSR